MSTVYPDGSYRESFASRDDEDFRESLILEERSND